MIRPYSESQTQEPLKSILNKDDGAKEIEASTTNGLEDENRRINLSFYTTPRFRNNFSHDIKETKKSRPPIEEVQGEELESSGQAQGTTHLPSFKKKEFNSYFNNYNKETEELESLDQAQSTTCWASIGSFLCSYLNILNSCPYEIIVDNSKSKITYFDNSEYEGELVNGNPHGQGTFTWPDGRIYVGKFENNQMHGQGTYTWLDGSSYTGQFENNQIQGDGTFTWTDGRKYTGGWIDNQMNGKGTYTCADGRTYEGQWQDDQIQGEGTLITWEDSVEIDGVTYRKGNKQEGTFVNSEISSGCVETPVIFITFNDRRTYTGEFKDGQPPQPHGQGKMTYVNGTKYEGGFKDGKRHGQGTFIFNNGDKCELKWIDGKVRGHGTIKTPTGITYKGKIVNGKMLGYEKITKV